MKAAANVVAVVAWLGFIGAIWYPLVADEMPAVGFWLGSVVLTFLTGVIVPSYLLTLEERTRAVKHSAARSTRTGANRE